MSQNSEKYLLIYFWYLIHLVQNSKLLILRSYFFIYDKEKHQILTLEKLEPANIWPFYLAKTINPLPKQLPNNILLIN